MQSFLKLPRYLFSRSAIEHAPSEPGIFALFDGDEIIYIGRADDREKHSIKAMLLLHQDGAFGSCTMKATHYTWEINIWPGPRETELLARYEQSFLRNPRCAGKPKAA